MGALVIAALLLGSPDTVQQTGASVTVHDCQSYASAVDLGPGVGRYVQIEFSIDPAGVVEKPFLATSSGIPAFDRAMTACVSSWRYQPALQNNQPVTVTWGVQFLILDGKVYVQENFAKAHYCKLAP